MTIITKSPSSDIQETKDQKTEIKKTEIKIEDQVKDLGLLPVQQKLFVISLPKLTSSVVVNYTHGLRVSCVIEPFKHTILVTDGDDDYDYYDEDDNTDNIKDQKQLKIKHKTLLMSINYADIPRLRNIQIHDISIFALNKKVKKRIEVTPYMISNVYSDGRICWGNINTPHDLKTAYNTFWCSPFTGDLDGEEFSFVDSDDADYDDRLDYIRKYNNKLIKTQEFEDQTDVICGKKFWAAPKGADAVLVATGSLLTFIPPEYWRRDSNNLPIVVALANLKKDIWECESGKFKFSLPTTMVTRKIY